MLSLAKNVLTKLDQQCIITEYMYILRKMPHLVQCTYILQGVSCKQCLSAWGASPIVLPCSHGPVSQNYHPANVMFSKNPMLEEQACNAILGCYGDNYLKMQL